MNRERDLKDIVGELDTVKMSDNKKERMYTSIVTNEPKKSSRLRKFLPILGLAGTAAILGALFIGNRTGITNLANFTGKSSTQQDSTSPIAATDTELDSSQANADSKISSLDSGMSDANSSFDSASAENTSEGGF